MTRKHLKLNKRRYWRLDQATEVDLEKALDAEREARGVPSLSAADLAREALCEWMAVRGYLSREREATV